MTQNIYKLYQYEKLHLINIKCNDSDSFKYSALFYLYYYNIKNNYNKPSETEVTIVKLNGQRYSLYKSTIECFNNNNNNTNEINRINSVPPKIYKLTDEIKKICV